MADEKNKKSAEHDTTAQNNDPVNHPAHYTTGKIEVIDYIEDQKLPYHLGNAVKYISRAGKKDKDKTKGKEDVDEDNIFSPYETL